MLLSADILGGTPASDPQTFALFTVLPAGAGNRLYCTATLIGARTLLTAAHCADALGPGSGDIVAANADDVSAGTAGLDLYRVTDRAVHPDWSTSSLGPVYHGRDQALLLLDHDPPVPPRELGFGPFELGLRLRILGYGDMGHRMVVEVPLTRLPPGRLQYDQTGGVGPCGGDSGGPTLLGDVLVGVTSYGDDTCTTIGFSSRIDAAFIHTWFLTHEIATCQRDTLCLEGCNDRDCLCPLDRPDCLPTCTTCRGAFEACNADSDCADALCIDATDRYCAPTCPLDGSVCVEGSQCDALSGVCQKPRPVLPEEPVKPPKKAGCGSAASAMMAAAVALRRRRSATNVAATSLSPKSFLPVETSEGGFIRTR